MNGKTRHRLSKKDMHLQACFNSQEREKPDIYPLLKANILEKCLLKELVRMWIKL